MGALCAFRKYVLLTLDNERYIECVKTPLNLG